MSDTEATGTYDTAATFLVTVGAFAAFVLSFALGANDVSNALGTSVGSRALTFKQAAIIGAIFEFLGTVLMGAGVSNTLKSEVVNLESFQGDEMVLFVIGMFSSLVAASIWLMFATIVGLPVSTTQTIIGGLVGFGIIEKGFLGVSYQTIGNILLSWIVSPLLGGIISFLLYYNIKYLVLVNSNPRERCYSLMPYYASFTTTILLLFIIVSQAHMLPEGSALGAMEGTIFLFVILSAVTWLLSEFMFVPYLKEQERQSGWVIRERIKNSCGFENAGNVMAHSHEPGVDKKYEREEYLYNLEIAEWQFMYLMILSAVFVAFAHGANDVSNAVGPYAAILEFKLTGNVQADSGTPLSIIFAGGVGIVIGLATMGYKVMETVGEKITKLTFSRGYAAQLGTAATVLLASHLALPISTTTTLIGAITGVGLIKPVDGGVGGSISTQVLVKIVAGWFFTVIVGAVLSVMIYGVLKFIFV